MKMDLFLPINYKRIVIPHRIFSLSQPLRSSSASIAATGKPPHV